MSVSKPRGGTELMADRINTLPAWLLSKFQITHSRDVNMSVTKKNILVLHDGVLDPMHDHLRDGGWKRFDKIVFVSHWQKQQFRDYMGLPASASVVLKNAITPIEEHTKPIDKIRLVYFSTPHRGLNLLYAAFVELAKEFSNLELNVFSSFDLYAWPERDIQYQELFEKLEAHPQINYSKSVSNDQIREELKRNHILAYPSTWEETSCLVLIEAMSAGLLCVHSSLAALPETSLSLTRMYDYHENPSQHVNQFYAHLRQAILTYADDNTQTGLLMQKAVADKVYSWDNRKEEWKSLLASLL
jgi:glycosyltransferase involved in cell wall biosynthesis